MTKSELKEMIRECLREELTLHEGAMNGGQAEGGFLDTSKRAGGPTKNWKDALAGKKTKTVKAKDLKPGMITSTGEVKSITDAGWVNGKASVEVSYGGIGAQGSYASDCVAADKDYEVLDEACDNTKLKEDATSGTMNWEELLAEADHLLDDLIVKSDNKYYDDGDGYWQEEYTTWCNRKLYYTRLNDTVVLEKLRDEYSKKLPNVEFYFYDDEDEEVSEIGYIATKADYED